MVAVVSARRDCALGDVSGEHATAVQRRGGGLLLIRCRQYATLLQPETNMNKTTKMMCCAALGLGAALLPIQAKADTDGDKKFLAMAAQSDVNEIALSKLAEQKATDPAVKAFAEKMVAEHTKMSETMKPFAVSWVLTPPTGPDEEHQKDLEKLDKLSGKDFDKEYIDIMVSDHSKALSAFTTEAKDTRDANFKVVVLQGKTMVAAHKNMAYDLKKKL
jgi:putative membrane protein